MKNQPRCIQALFKEIFLFREASIVKWEVWRHLGFSKIIKGICEKLILITEILEAISLADLRQNLQ